MSNNPTDSLPVVRDGLRGPVLACGALIFAALTAAGVASLSRESRKAAAAESVRQAPVAASRDVRFEDRAGAVVVIDAASGTQIAEIARGEDGFVRATMRSLARERKSSGIGAEAPFRIARGLDGRVTLDDPVTGRSIALSAFGSTNEQAFGRFLSAPAR